MSATTGVARLSNADAVPDPLGHLAASPWLGLRRPRVHSGCGNESIPTRGSPFDPAGSLPEHKNTRQIRRVSAEPPERIELSTFPYHARRTCAEGCVAGQIERGCVVESRRSSMAAGRLRLAVRLPSSGPPQTAHQTTSTTGP